mmetsp:Transcript_4759/g.9626  ORF Transcript_4759/g.9626 Transcript_4759/m.9626 type:complete len:135 (+) Transcript_4759:1020-1424(+)
MSFFFTNFGPNATTFLIPSEIFPTKLRSTCHGISAATGKVGAFVGGIALRPVVNAFGVRVAFLICALTAALGSIWTLIFIPTYDSTYDEDVDPLLEDESERQGLQSNGAAYSTELSVLSKAATDEGVNEHSATL